jgi:hypothetical protein
VTSAPEPKVHNDRPTLESGRDAGGERRSIRHQAERRRRTATLFSLFAPGAALVLVLALLFPLLASPGATGDPGAGESYSATLAPKATPGSPQTTPDSGPPNLGELPAGSSASALLVVEQQGVPVGLTLIGAGDGGGVVLAIPGLTLLRSGDRFTRVSSLYSADQPRAVALAVGDALGLPVAAVVSVDWDALQEGLTAAGVELLPAVRPEAPEQMSAQLAVAVAALLDESAVEDGQTPWTRLPLSGDSDAFRAEVSLALAMAKDKGWAAHAVPGTLVDRPEGAYFEADVRSANKLLAASGIGE